MFAPDLTVRLAASGYPNVEVDLVGPRHSAALAYMAEVAYAAGPALQGPRAPGQNKKNVCCLIAE